MSYLGAFLTGFLLVGGLYHPEFLLWAGVTGVAICTLMLPVTLTVWFVRQIIRELKA